MNYIRTQKVGTGASAFVVDAALADRAAADSTTSGRIYNAALGRYTADGNLGTTGATQAAQALALDEGPVPDGEQPRTDVRALMQGGRDDVLWNVIHEDTQPSQGFFLASTTANPDGLTTMPEFWDLHDSKNHIVRW